VTTPDPVRAVYAQSENGSTMRQSEADSRARGLTVPAPRSPYLTVEQVAERLHRSIRVVHELARLGEIPHRKLPGSRRLLFREDELEAWEDGAELELTQGSRGGRVVRPKVAR
jgi:excisionase family DNA binding protein